MNDIRPINYKIHLEPDLIKFKFVGSTEILIDADKPVHEVVLNVLELAVWSCKVNTGVDFISCDFLIDPKQGEMKVFFPEEMSGRISLKIDYLGEINNGMAGFYRSKYIVDGKEKYLAVTQFQEDDARRAFPCFDRPLQKATFDIEMIVDEDLSAISNGPIAEEKDMGNGKKIIRFQQTPVMSTYLLFFGVGEFEFIEVKGNVPVRAATTPGMTKYAGFGLEFGRKSLEFSESYYGIKYALPKLDLIAISDFAAGAMENWGAITFRENLLLHYPDITSKAGEERICEVIAHEIAHQWFGNLVTPSDWKYLWLNESFATFFGYGIVNNFFPDWGIWPQFLQGQTEIALNRDSLFETFPIEIPGGVHAVINVSTAPIIYNKGGSILRQIEGYVGEENFKEGLRRYLKKHMYACASSHHLWEAFEEASDLPVLEIMKSWIEQPGFPMIETSRDGNNLHLTQKRFTFAPNESEQEWLVPISIGVYLENGDSKTLTILLDRKSTVVDMGGDILCYKLNHEQRGFYRVKYLEKDNLQRLGKMVAQKRLSPEDRWGLQNDLYALVKSCEVSMDEFLDFLSFYGDEDNFLPLSGIADNLFHAYLIMDGRVKDRIASAGTSLFEKVLGNMGYEPKKDEKHTTSLLRDKIMWHAVVYGSKEASEVADKEFALLLKGGKIHPDIMKSVMQTGALNMGDKAYEWFANRLKSSQSEHERMNIHIAMGSFKDQRLIEKALQFILDQTPDRNKFVSIGQMSTNPYAIPVMWEWYQLHLNRLEQLHPMHYERAIAAIIPFSGLGKEDQIRSFFSDYMRIKKDYNDVIKLSLERLDINSRLRRS